MNLDSNIKFARITEIIFFISILSEISILCIVGRIYKQFIILSAICILILALIFVIGFIYMENKLKEYKTEKLIKTLDKYKFKSLKIKKANKKIYKNISAKILDQDNIMIKFIYYDENEPDLISIYTKKELKNLI